MAWSGGFHKVILFIPPLSDSRPDDSCSTFGAASTSAIGSGLLSNVAELPMTGSLTTAELADSFAEEPTFEFKKLQMSGFPTISTHLLSIQSREIRMSSISTTIYFSSPKENHITMRCLTQRKKLSVLLELHLKLTTDNAFAETSKTCLQFFKNTLFLKCNFKTSRISL
jgi:hypothetical protein